jgi:hypothetical protein
VAEVVVDTSAVVAEAVVRHTSVVVAAEAEADMSAAAEAAARITDL